MTSSDRAPLLALHNALKQSPTSDDLVPAQQMVLDEIRSLLEEYRLVALVGPQAAGKTFLAWVLQHDFDFTYHQWPVGELNATSIVVDDAPSERVDARSMRVRCRFNDVENCIYITKQHFSEAETVPAVSLTLLRQEQRSIINKWIDILSLSAEFTADTVLSGRRELNRYST